MSEKENQGSLFGKAAEGALPRRARGEAAG